MSEFWETARTVTCSVTVLGQRFGCLVFERLQVQPMNGKPMNGAAAQVRFRLGPLLRVVPSLSSTIFNCPIEYRQNAPNKLSESCEAWKGNCITTLHWCGGINLRDLSKPGGGGNAKCIATYH